MSPAFLAHGQGFSGQRGLVDTEKTFLEQLYIRGNDIPQAETDHIARHQLVGREFLPVAVPKHSALQRQLLL